MLIGLAIDFWRAFDYALRGGIASWKNRGSGADQGDGIHRPGNFHRGLDDGGCVSGDVIDEFQGHPGDGPHLRRRLAGQLHPDDDDVAGDAVTRETECN